MQKEVSLGRVESLSRNNYEQRRTYGSLKGFVPPKCPQLDLTTEAGGVSNYGRPM